METSVVIIAYLLEGRGREGGWVDVTRGMCSTAFSLNFINWIFWILNGQLFPGSSCLFQIISKILSWRWPLGTATDPPPPPPIHALSVCFWSIGSDQIALRVGGVSLIYDPLSVPQTQQCVTLFTLNYSIIHIFVVLSRTVYFHSRSFSSSLNSLPPQAFIQL